MWQIMALRSSPMPRWRTLNDAARETGISRRTLNRLISRGELRVYTVVGDRRHYVDLDEVEKLKEPRPKEPGT
jgi:excisionase family DNA binding protein